jgi:hypothetical protein
MIGTRSQASNLSHAPVRDRPPLRSQSRHMAHVFTPPSVSVQQRPHTMRLHDAHGPAASRPQNAQAGADGPPSTGCSAPVTATLQAHDRRGGNLAQRWGAWASSLDCYGLRQITRLVDVGALEVCHMVGEQLKGQHRQKRENLFARVGDQEKMRRDVGDD